MPMESTQMNVEAEFKPHHSTRRHVTESSTGANAGTLPKSDEIHSQRLHVGRPEIREEMKQEEWPTEKSSGRMLKHAALTTKEAADHKNIGETEKLRTRCLQEA